MSDNTNAQLLLSQGQLAFECGQYQSAIQCFEQGKIIASVGTALHGELQIWLVTAYEAAGDRSRAIGALSGDRQPSGFGNPKTIKTAT